MKNKNTKKYAIPIDELARKFSIETHIFLKKCKPQYSSIHILKQLYRSSSSVAANIIEAKNSVTRKELARKYTLSLGEARESDYWLTLLKIEYPDKDKEIEDLCKNLSELIAILTSCVKKLRQP